MRKVTDLKYNEVIHCPTKELFMAIGDLSLKAGLNWKERWWNSISIGELCYCPEKGFARIGWFEDRGYIIYPATDFIDEDIKVGDCVIMLKAGGWGYHPDNNGCIAQVTAVNSRELSERVTPAIAGTVLNPKKKDYVSFTSVPVLYEGEVVVRKATTEEISNYFRGNNYLKTKDMKTRLLSRSNFKRIHDAACSSWKSKLAEKFQAFAFQDEIEVHPDFYAEIRKACTKEQNLLFDDIFGKDEIDNLAIPKDLDKTRFNNAVALLSREVGLADRIERIFRCATKAEYSGRGFYLKGKWEINQTASGYEAIPLKD
jgi:hypothetical protein